MKCELLVILSGLGCTRHAFWKVWTVNYSFHFSHFPFGIVPKLVVAELFTHLLLEMIRMDLVGAKASSRFRK